MRGGSIGGGLRLAALAGLASSAMAAPLAAVPVHPEPDAKPRRPRPKGKRSSRAGYRIYDRLPAGINRHTGRPHEHEREKSRRLRQECVAELNRANRYLRSVRKPTIGFGDPLPEFGLTRSGRKVPLA